MASVRTLLAVFVCMAAVHSSLQDDKLMEKRKELLKFVQKLESSLKRHALKREMKNEEELQVKEREARSKHVQQQHQQERKREQLQQLEELRRAAEREIQQKMEQQKRIKVKQTVEQDKIAEELADMTQEIEEKVEKRLQDYKSKKGVCANRLKAGKCQLLRWFGKSCEKQEMRRDCKASCGQC